MALKLVGIHTLWHHLVLLGLAYSKPRQTNQAWSGQAKSATGCDIRHLTLMFTAMSSANLHYVCKHFNELVWGPLKLFSFTFMFMLMQRLLQLKVHVQFRVLRDSTALACHSAKINVNIIVNINFYTIIVNITQMVYLYLHLSRHG